MKKIKVKVKNSWLNALEDILFTKLDKKEKVLATKKAAQLWHTLVAAYDKEKKNA